MLNSPKPSRTRALAVAAAAGLIVLLGAGPGPAHGAMTSVKLGPGLWKTTGGGRFVDIKQFPGEKIDRRLLRDIRFLKRKYKIFVTDGYSLDPVHSANGEHPIGLALDIGPYTSIGGTWDDISALARFAEPEQNVPRPPFRWVGYDGDAGHGRGHHLHLSYSHSPTAYDDPARTVYTLRDPVRDGSTEPPDDGGGLSSGGIQANRGATPPPLDSGGGLHLRVGAFLYDDALLAPVAAETGGVDLR